MLWDFRKLLRVGIPARSILRLIVLVVHAQPSDADSCTWLRELSEETRTFLLSRLVLELKLSASVKLLRLAKNA